MSTFQFAGSLNGWRESKPIILKDISEEEAIKISKVFAKAYSKEVRLSNVTGYENLEERNSRGELMGNGMYFMPI